MSVLSNLWKKVKGVFGFDIDNIILSAAKTETGLLANGLKDIAAEVVLNLVPAIGLSGAEKQKQAFDAIVNRCVQEGIEFTTASVNLAIESVVALAKAVGK